MHSFVLDAVDTTGPHTFSHFEMLIDEHRKLTDELNQEMNSIQISSQRNLTPHSSDVPQRVTVNSRLQQLVPSVGTFYTRLPLRKAFEAYNAKYGVSKRKYVAISFNEIRHILNLAQIIAMIHPPEGRNGTRSPSPTLALSTTGSGISDQNIESGVLAERVERQSAQSAVDSAALEAWASMGQSTPRLPDDSERQSEDVDDDHNGKKVDVPHLDEESSGRLHLSRRSDTRTIEEALSLLPTCSALPGPKLICFDGDQTLYSDGANFEKGPNLAKYLYLLLKYGVTIAVVTAAGYEYQAEKYELRLSGLLAYFQERGLQGEDLERFYIFGGECNYLLRLGNDYRLHAVREDGPGGWITSTKYFSESPGNWSEADVTSILDRAEASFQKSVEDQNIRGRIIRKKRSVGLIPKMDESIRREALDETVLRIQTELDEAKVTLPFCAFNGGRDAWVDVGNKRVGVQVLQSYLGIAAEETLHIGDQFLNTGNDFAARTCCPCVWITSPEETEYILKSILRLAGVPLMALMNKLTVDEDKAAEERVNRYKERQEVNFDEVGRRSTIAKKMDVFTGEYITKLG